VNRLFLAVGCTVMFLAQGAAATVLDVTYRGTFLSGSDPLGDFSAPGTNLTGQSYSLTFRYDTGIGQRMTAPGTLDWLFGGSAYGKPTPLVQTTLSFGGTSHTFGGSRVGAVLSDIITYGGGWGGPVQPPDARFAAEADDRWTDSATGMTVTSMIFATCNGLASSFPAPAVDTPFGVSSCAGGMNGAIRFNRLSGSGTVLSSSGASLSVSQMQVSAVPPAPVPLPAGGGLLMAALAGLAGSRRRARNTVARG